MIDVVVCAHLMDMAWLNYITLTVGSCICTSSLHRSVYKVNTNKIFKQK